MQLHEATQYRDARFHRLPDDAGVRFDRTPFPYEHNLSNLDLFEFEALCDLARKFDHDYFVAGGALTPAADFYSVRYGEATPYDALRRLDTEHRRILLKRPEQYDARYRDLMHGLFEQAIALRGGLERGEHLERLDSSILISSAATITPFHFDPEVSFFFQIAGDKIYHVFAPSALTEPELERFYWMGIVNIGQVDLAGRDPQKEHVFQLRAGLGMHQPQNSPHWVETTASRSISYVFSFETNRSRALGRTRAFNHYLRKLGVRPSPPRARPALDGAKAAFMNVAIPLRKRVSAALRRRADAGRQPFYVAVNRFSGSGRAGNVCGSIQRSGPGGGGFARMTNTEPSPARSAGGALRRRDGALRTARDDSQSRRPDPGRIRARGC